MSKVSDQDIIKAQHNLDIAIKRANELRAIWKDKQDDKSRFDYQSQLSIVNQLAKKLNMLQDWKKYGKGKPKLEKL